MAPRFLPGKRLALAVDKAQFKQRIVGAIVLVALGVIFIPIILNRDDNGPGISGSNIPDKPPALAQLPAQEVTPPPPPPQAPAETRQLVDERTPETTTESQPPAAGAAPTPEQAPVVPAPQGPSQEGAWVLQVASFSDRSKALALRDRLRAKKYTAFVESITTKSATLYRVRVGPVLHKEQAQRLQDKVSAEFKIKDTLVMAHP